MAGLHIPTTPVDHQHIALKAVPGHEFSHDTPCLRDPDNLVYLREEQGGLVVGGYELNPNPRWIDGVPWEHGGKSLPPDYDRFEPLLEGVIRRIPHLERAEIVTLVCHPGAYTPDSRPLLGPLPGVRGFWCAAGLSLNGYGGAGGMGKVLAEWIIEGEPSLDVFGFHAWRFGRSYADHPSPASARAPYHASALSTTRTRPAAARQPRPLPLPGIGAAPERRTAGRANYFNRKARARGRRSAPWGWTGRCSTGCAMNTPPPARRLPDMSSCKPSCGRCPPAPAAPG
jgi:hypothetical protein